MLDPDRLSMAMRAHTALWSSARRKMVTSLTAIIVGTTGSIVGVHSAWPIVEPVFPAHHEWVRELLRDETKPIMTVQNTQAVSIDRFLLYQTQKELEAAKRDPAATTSPIVQERIRSLDEQAKATAERIRRATGR